MPPGKLAAQAGHAFLNTYLNSLQTNPDIATEYQKDGIGTKICLQAKNLENLLTIKNLAQEAGLVTSLITDSGHILPPHFTGEPIITALGIGPCRRNEIHNITKKLKLVK